MSKIFYIDPTYIKYRQMWFNDRWKFSGIMVNLTIKKSNSALDDIEEHTLSTMNRIVDENGGNWIDNNDSKKIYKKR